MLNVSNFVRDINDTGVHTAKIAGEDTLGPVYPRCLHSVVFQSYVHPHCNISTLYTLNTV